MLRTVQEFVTRAGDTAELAKSISDEAQNIVSEIKAFRDWAEAQKKSSQERHDAVTEALNEQNGHIQAEFTAMLTKLSAMVTALEGSEKAGT